MLDTSLTEMQGNTKQSPTLYTILPPLHKLMFLAIDSLSLNKF